MIIKTEISLLGDFLGTLPALIEKNKKEKILLIASISDSLKKLIPKNIELIESDGFDYVPDVTLDIHRAWRLANEKGLYMSQCYFDQLDLQIPIIKEKVLLDYDKKMTQVVDYIISPFSRSLPESQKVSSKVFQDAVDDNPDILFALIGVEGMDDSNFINGKNVIKFFNKDLHYICNLMQNSTKGLISVVTGTSHLAFHLSVFNILFSNQGATWGNNPEALIIGSYIPQTTYEKNLKQYLK